MRKTPVVLGVLSIIFGSLGAVMSLLTMALGPLFAKMADFTANVPGQNETQRAALAASQESFAHMTGYLVTTSAVLVAMSTALVIIGVGLYRRRAWARGATVTWASVAIALVVVNFILSVAWLTPRQLEIQRQVYAQHGVTPAFEMGRTSTAAAGFFGGLMYCAFPTVLLALIGRRSAVNDFLPPAATASTPAA